MNQFLHPNQMTASELRSLCDALKAFPNISRRWPALFVLWIKQADGYLEMMTLDPTDSTPRFLLDSLLAQLQAAPSTIGDDELAKLASENFELLFMRAQYGGEFWDSTKESFLNFYLKHCEDSSLANIPNQIIIDEPHTKPEAVRVWLHEFLR